MTQEQKIVLQVLSNALFDKPLLVPNDINWESVLSESRDQAVFLTVYRTVRDLLPVELMNSWDPLFYKYTARNIRVFHAHTHIHEILSQNEIPYIILKGCASAKYYPQPADRIMGDVDFLVAKRDVERCSMILKKEGMKRCDNGLHGFHRSYSLAGVVYELHWSPPGIPAKGNEKIEKYLNNVIKSRAVFCDNNVNCYVPDNYHHAIIVLLHNAAHMTTTGIGLRHLCDWTLLVSSLSEEETEKLLHVFDDVGLLTYAKVLTALGTIYLGAPHKSWTDIDSCILLDELMEDIIKSGNFGIKETTRQYQGAFIRDVRTRKISRQSIIRALFSTINWKAKGMYPSLTNHFFTVPIAWILVCCYYLFQVVLKKRPGFSIRDTVSINKRKKLYGQLNLFE